MTHDERRWVQATARSMLALALGASSAAADINLELRPLSQTVPIGQTVDMGLFAVSDNGEITQTLSAADIVVAWDPAALRLLGLDQTGAAPLLLSGFPANDPYGLNEVVPPQDGDGYYQVLAILGAPVEATVPGTLLTTLRFDALSLSAGTPVNIPASGGNPALNTTVFDGEVPNTIVTGTLSGATVTIVPGPCPLPGDVNGDAAVNGADVKAFVDCLLTGSTPAGNCDCADLDGQPGVSVQDISPFVAMLIAG